jgi:hypothetical protein
LWYKLHFKYLSQLLLSFNKLFFLDIHQNISLDISIITFSLCLPFESSISPFSDPSLFHFRSFTFSLFIFHLLPSDRSHVIFRTLPCFTLHSFFRSNHSPVRSLTCTQYILLLDYQILYWFPSDSSLVSLRSVPLGFFNSDCNCHLCLLTSDPELIASYPPHVPVLPFPLLLPLVLSNQFLHKLPSETDPILVSFKSDLLFGFLQIKFLTCFFLQNKPLSCSHQITSFVHLLTSDHILCSSLSDSLLVPARCQSCTFNTLHSFACADFALESFTFPFLYSCSPLISVRFFHHIPTVLL